MTFIKRTPMASVGAMYFLSPEAYLIIFYQNWSVALQASKVSAIQLPVDSPWLFLTRKGKQVLTQRTVVSGSECIECWECVTDGWGPRKSVAGFAFLPGQ